MKRISLLILIAGLCSLALAAGDDGPKLDPAIAVVLESHGKQVAAAEERYNTTVTAATELRDKAVATANKAATQQMLGIARRMTQGGKLGDAVVAYQHVARLDPKNEEAIKTLKAVGVGAAKDEQVAVAKATNEAKKKTLKWGGALSIAAKWDYWSPIVMDAKAGQVINIKAGGTYKLPRGNEEVEIGPAGKTVQGIAIYHLEGRMSTSPENTFRIADMCKIIVPAAGKLEVRVAVPDKERPACKGAISVQIATDATK